MSKLGGGPGSGFATEEKQDAIIDAIQNSNVIIKEWTQVVISVGTTPVMLSPDPNQIYIRVVPLVDGNFYYGTSNAINSTNSEVFSKAAPIEITIDDDVYIVKESGSGNVVVYRGSYG